MPPPDRGARAHGRGPGAITPDGCAVEVYRRLPPAGEAELVHGAVPAGAAVLDLGCGTGRIAAPLAALGHRVVGVDTSQEMLALVDPAVTAVRSSIEDLDLPERFAGVLMASHLVNTPDAEDRAALLAAAARHLAAGGVLVAQWHPPQWFDRLRPGGRHAGALGAVATELEVLELSRSGMEAVVRYRVGDLRWEQWFRAARLGIEALDADLAGAGLRRTAWLTPGREWFAAVTAQPSRPNHGPPDSADSSTSLS
jgi:SAM-dependent methyltransferase